MTKEDIEFFTSIGMIKGKRKAKSHTLVYKVGKLEGIVNGLEKRDYALCEHWRQKTTRATTVSDGCSCY